MPFLKICPCGRRFVSRYRARYRFCSRSCSNRLQPRPSYGRRNGRWKPKIMRECRVCHRKMDINPSHIATKHFCSRQCLGAWSSARRLVITKPERTVADALAGAGIEFTLHCRIGSWEVDFLLPAHQVVIEVDGAYWHSLPENARRDQRKDDDLRSRALTVVRILESEALNPEKLYLKRLNILGIPFGEPYIWLFPQAGCRVTDCPRQISKRKLCGPHLWRLKMFGDPMKGPPIKERALSCSINKCERHPHARNLCSLHYQRFQRHGSTLLHPRHSILTANQVEEIRQAKLNGEATGVLATKYGVTDGHISNICSKRCWRLL